MTADDETKRPRTTTAQSRELGAELRAVRRTARLTGQKVATELDWSTAKLSKLEKGWRSTSLWDIGVLLGKCGADKATRDRVVGLAREEHAGHFVRTHGEDSADALLSLTLHERLASSLTCYEPMTVPVLLQNEGYARALLTSAGHSPDRIESLIRCRVDRQQTLSGKHYDNFVFYIHEAALHLRVGDRAVMQDQAEHLVFLSTRARLTIRVVPMDVGNHPALQLASTVLTFRHGLKPLAYAQSDTATTFVEDDHALTSHQAKHSALSALALDVERSRNVFARWTDERSLPDSNVRVCS